MGLRMYVSHPDDENSEVCYGKCFGYSVETHLYSLDYLVSIDIFSDCDINSVLWNVRDPGDMKEYFSIAQFVPAMYLTREQYERFILLYLSDQVAMYGDVVYAERDKNQFDIGDESVVKIEWY